MLCLHVWENMLSLYFIKQYICHTFSHIIERTGNRDSEAQIYAKMKIFKYLMFDCECQNLWTIKKFHLYNTFIAVWMYCHNPNSTQSWVWHENDFRPPPTTTTTNSMSLISQLFLARFKPNFKNRLAESTTVTITTTWTTTTTTTEQ